MRGSRKITSLARALAPFANRTAGSVVDRIISAAAGAGIFVDANTIHLSGSTILLRRPGAARLAEYPATTEGLQAALAAAVAGDTVLLPGGTIAGGVTVPAGVTLRGLDRDRTVIAGLVTVAGTLANLSVVRSGAGEVIGVTDGGGAGVVTNCRVSVTSSDGAAYCISVTSGGSLEVRECDCAASGITAAEYRAVAGDIYVYGGSAASATPVSGG